jgi:hypothetical protein
MRLSILYQRFISFIFHPFANIAYLLFYVDDIVLTTSDSFLQHIISSLNLELLPLALLLLYFYLSANILLTYYLVLA